MHGCVWVCVNSCLGTQQRMGNDLGVRHSCRLASEVHIHYYCDFSHFTLVQESGRCGERRRSPPGRGFQRGLRPLLGVKGCAGSRGWSANRDTGRWGATERPTGASIPRPALLWWSAWAVSTPSSAGAASHPSAAADRRDRRCVRPVGIAARRAARRPGRVDSRRRRRLAGPRARLGVPPVGRRVRAPRRRRHVRTDGDGAEVLRRRRALGRVSAHGHRSGAREPAARCHGGEARGQAAQSAGDRRGSAGEDRRVEGGRGSVSAKPLVYRDIAGATGTDACRCRPGSTWTVQP